VRQEGVCRDDHFLQEAPAKSPTKEPIGDGTEPFRLGRRKGMALT
jgi:hypothetical protein